MTPQSRKTKTNGAAKGGIPLPIVILLAAVVAVFAWRLAAPTKLQAQHPTPRDGITADKIVEAKQFAAADIAEVYAMAKEIPEVLDGIYCYCDCSKHSGHRSLITCFETEHGSNCDICMGEARLAYKLHKEGKSLQEIRAQIDAQFGHS